MNVAQAKAIPLTALLDRMGHPIARTSGRDAWYRSPLREEKTPSFKVDTVKNLWFDHGAGQGGTIIDLAQRMGGVADVSAALDVIERIMGGAGAALAMPKASPVLVQEKAKPEIERVGEIESSRLIRYLREARHIPPELARLYLQEVHYRLGERRFQALGFPNRSGGFELRSATFQGTIGKKDISFLAQPERTDAAAFEGVFDFLSALAHYRMDKPTGNVLVLNSVALLSQGIEALQASGVQKVGAYFDHDPAGRSALGALTAQLQDVKVRDESGLYVGHKDFNDYWQALRSGAVPGRA